MSTWLPIDGKGPINKKTRPVESKAPGIMARQSVLNHYKLV